MSRGVDFTPLTEAHLEDFEPAHWRVGECEDLKAVLRQAIDLEGSRCCAMLLDGRVVGIGGVLKLGQQLGWAMFMPAKGVNARDWARALPTLWAWLDDVQAHGVRRIEAMVNADFAEAHMTALVLGFRYDGDRDGWEGTDRPAMVYTRLRPETLDGPWVRECRRELHLARLSEHCPSIVPRVRRGFAPQSPRGR